MPHPLLLQPQAARARQPLNPDIETMCDGLVLINQKLGATAAPGTPTPSCEWLN